MRQEPEETPLLEYPLDRTPVFGRHGPFLLLLCTIVFETSGTLLLKRAFDGRLFVAAAFACYFTGLSLFTFVLRYIPLSVAYTTWCALGTVGVCSFSHFFYGETISLAKIICIVITIPCVIGLYVLP